MKQFNIIFYEMSLGLVIQEAPSYIVSGMSFISLYYMYNEEHQT